MEDCWFMIFEYAFSQFEDFCRVRSVSKHFCEISNLLWFRSISRMIPPRTFISVDICSVCDGKSSRCKSVPYGGFPSPVYVYCNNFECTRHVIRNMVENAKETNILLLIDEAVVEYGHCPRSDGSTSECMFMQGWMWNSKRVRCLMGNKFKDVSLDDIDAQYKKKYRILKL